MNTTYPAALAHTASVQYSHQSIQIPRFPPHTTPLRIRYHTTTPLETKHNSPAAFHTFDSTTTKLNLGACSSHLLPVTTRLASKVQSYFLPSITWDFPVACSNSNMGFCISVQQLPRHFSARESVHLELELIACAVSHLCDTEVPRKHVLDATEPQGITSS